MSTPPTAPKPIAFGASYTMTVGSLYSPDHTWLSWISNSLDIDVAIGANWAIKTRRQTTSGDGGRTKGFPHGKKIVVLGPDFDMTFGQRSGDDGQTIFLSGAPYVIIGVIDPTFNVGEFGLAPEVQVPFHLDLNSTDGVVLDVWGASVLS